MNVIPEGDKSFLVTLLLSYFLGFFGADRFYLGKTRSAVWKLITLGGIGYWWIIDLIWTLIGRQRDARGMRLAGYDKYKKAAWIVMGGVFGASFAAVLVRVAFGVDSPTATGWVFLGTLTAAAVATFIVWLVRRRNTGDKRVRAADEAEPLPPRIRPHIEKLSALRQQYVLHAAAGIQAAGTVVGQLDSLISNVRELFRRLGSKSAVAQRVRAQENYDDMLGRLVAALDRDYMLDVLINPQLWDNPGQRVTEVQEAIRLLDAQLLNNIKQLNADRGLEFQIGLDGITDPR